MIERIRQWARKLKREIVALWFACQDERTPLAAKLLALFTVGYALSPIDLIPDFIPVLGFLDDALLLPAFVWLTLKLVPPEVLADCLPRAQAWLDSGAARPRSHVAATIIVLLWIAGAWALWRLFRGH